MTRPSGRGCRSSPSRRIRHTRTTRPGPHDGSRSSSLSREAKGSPTVKVVDAMARILKIEDVTRRVIFLDIDGVLAPIRRGDRYGDLDPACIEVLNEIVVRAGADVVVSSTWRHGKTAAELQEILEAQGFTGRVVDKTPTGTPGADRRDEIAAWLAEH